MLVRHKKCPTPLNLPHWPIAYSEATSSRPLAAAALAIPDRAALVFSAYCSGMRVDLHPPARVSPVT
jgi:hypothetical protein